MKTRVCLKYFVNDCWPKCKGISIFRVPDSYSDFKTKKWNKLLAIVARDWVVDVNLINFHVSAKLLGAEKYNVYDTCKI